MHKRSSLSFSGPVQWLKSGTIGDKPLLLSESLHRRLCQNHVVNEVALIPNA